MPDQICHRCGMPKTATNPDGTIMIMRCLCEYQRECLERRASIVDKSYWGLNMGNWDPDIYKPDKCIFPKYIQAQRIMTIYKIWEYCFKPYSTDGKNIYALQRSISEGRNLFIRGPANSGRGLLSACIKTVAAIKAISTTPVPCEFSVFKSEVQESESQSRAGDEARIVVGGKYLAPQLLVLENVRAESQIDITGRRVARKFRASGAIDSLLARRAAGEFGMLMTSYDFMGDIADTLGDVMMDLLSSNKTTSLLLLSPKEAEAVLWTLDARKTHFKDVLKAFAINTDAAGMKMLQERMAEKITLASLEEGLYFEEAFSDIPKTKATTGSDIHEQFNDGRAKFDSKAMGAWVKFCEDRSRSSLAYEKGLAAAKISAIKACKELSSSLSDKECVEIGQIASMAMYSDEELANLEKKSKEFMSDMGVL